MWLGGRLCLVRGQSQWGRWAVFRKGRRTRGEAGVIMEGGLRNGGLPFVLQRQGRIYLLPIVISEYTAYSFVNEAPPPSQGSL